MRYLLDTCVISDFVKGIGKTAERLRSEPPHAIAVSAITAMELQYGLLLKPAKVKKIAPLIQDMVEAVHVLPYAKHIVKETAAIRAKLKRQGTPIGAYDLLIGATAKVHNLVLVTSNTSEFERIEGLTSEDWR